MLAVALSCGSEHKISACKLYNEFKPEFPVKNEINYQITQQILVVRLKIQ
jgi:hypothetical protein